MFFAAFLFCGLINPIGGNSYGWNMASFFKIYSFAGYIIDIYNSVSTIVTVIILDIKNWKIYK